MFLCDPSQRTGTQRSKCAAIAIYAGIATLSVSCSRFETHDVLANVLAVEGEVIVIHRDKPARATASMLLKEGDRLRTAECSSTTISLVPGARIVLGENSELRVEKLQIHKLGTTVAHPVRARNAKVQLMHGSIGASVVFRPVRPHVRLHIATPTAIFEGAPGDIFYLRVFDDTSHIICAAGMVAVTGDTIKDSIILEAGYAQEFTKGAQKRPEPFRNADDFEAAQAALAGADASQELERARINAIPGMLPP